LAHRMRKQIGVTVKMVVRAADSWEAERLLEEVQGRFIHGEKLSDRKRTRKTQDKITVDAVAASVILRNIWSGERRRRAGLRRK